MIAEQLNDTISYQVLSIYDGLSHHSIGHRKHSLLATCFEEMQRLSSRNIENTVQRDQAVGCEDSQELNHEDTTCNMFSCIESAKSFQ